MAVSDDSLEARTDAADAVPAGLLAPDRTDGATERHAIDARCWRPARYAPRTARLRKEYCSFLGGVVRHSLIHDVEIWNESQLAAYGPRPKLARPGST